MRVRTVNLSLNITRGLIELRRYNPQPSPKCLQLDTFCSAEHSILQVPLICFIDEPFIAVISVHTVDFHYNESRRSLHHACIQRFIIVVNNIIHTFSGYYYYYQCYRRPDNVQILTLDLRSVTLYLHLIFHRYR